MACQERAALQEKYEEDVEAYTASERCDWSGDTAHAAEVAELNAQRNLQEHVVEHHCC